jgi:hypothetical protein
MHSCSGTNSYEPTQTRQAYQRDKGIDKNKGKGGNTYKIKDGSIEEKMICRNGALYGPRHVKAKRKAL